MFVVSLQASESEDMVWTIYPLKNMPVYFFLYKWSLYICCNQLCFYLNDSWMILKSCPQIACLSSVSTILIF